MIYIHIYIYYIYIYTEWMKKKETLQNNLINITAKKHIIWSIASIIEKHEEKIKPFAKLIYI